MKKRLKLNLQSRLQIKTVPSIRLANFIELPEKEFSRFIEAVENNPLFLKLANPLTPEERVIIPQKFPGTRFSPHCFLSLDEARLADASPINLSPVLERHHKAIKLIRKLGLDKFQKYFIERTSAVLPEDIARILRLKKSQVEAINELMNEVSIHSEFYARSSLGTGHKISYIKVAKIEFDKDKNPGITFFSPRHFIGRYKIDYEKVEQLKKRDFFLSEDIGKLNALFGKLELINRRKNILYQTILGIIEKQKIFFVSGNKDDMVCCLQKEIAHKLSVHPSLVCRAIYGKSLELPRGEEKPIKDFFLPKKEYIKRVILTLFKEHKKVLSDNQTAVELKKTFGISASRRAVSNYRRELNFPSSRKK
ncbi:MAG: hypothetical protein HY746_10485 [Elusimicrobia bacterium]|nr:hypothetical protein [Elusimicrobiota bacterium]